MATVQSIHARQSRAARELLGWTQNDLSDRSGISISAVKNYERGLTNSVGTTAAIRAAFEKEGIEFVLENSGGSNRVGVVRTEKD